MSDEEQVPTVGDTTAAVVGSLVGKVPVIGEALAIVVRDAYARRSTAAVATVCDIARHGGGTEHLSERLAADPVLEALFVDAVDGAARTGMEPKRRLLGRVVGAAVLDDATVDETQLVVRALRELDVPHVRFLEAMRRAWDSAPPVAPNDDKAWRVRQDLVSDAAQNMPAPVRAALVSTGTLAESAGFGGGIHIEGPTDFGRALLAELKVEGLEPVTPDVHPDDA